MENGRPYGRPFIVLALPIFTGSEPTATWGQRKRGISEARGEQVLFSEAYHEFVADSLSTMFADGKLHEKLLDLKKTDNAVFRKMKDWVDALAQRVERLYGGQTAQTAEGMFLQGQSKETVERLQELFAQALVEASDAYRGAEVQKNTDAKVGVQYELREYSQQQKKTGKAVSVLLYMIMQNSLHSLSRTPLPIKPWTKRCTLEQFLRIWPKESWRTLD